MKYPGSLEAAMEAARVCRRVALTAGQGPSRGKRPRGGARTNRTFMQRATREHWYPVHFGTCLVDGGPRVLAENMNYSEPPQMQREFKVSVGRQCRASHVSPIATLVSPPGSAWLGSKIEYRIALYHVPSFCFPASACGVGTVADTQPRSRAPFPSVLSRGHLEGRI